MITRTEQYRLLGVMPYYFLRSSPEELKYLTRIVTSKNVVMARPDRRFLCVSSPN